MKADVYNNSTTMARRKSVQSSPTPPASIQGPNIAANASDEHAHKGAVLRAREIAWVPPAQ